MIEFFAGFQPAKNSIISLLKACLRGTMIKKDMLNVASMRKHTHRGHIQHTGSMAIAKLVSPQVSLCLRVLFFAVNLPGIILIDQGIVKGPDIAAVKSVGNLAGPRCIVNIAHCTVGHCDRLEIGRELRFSFLTLSRS